MLQDDIKTENSLTDIYGPVSKDLVLVEEELKNIIREFSFHSTKDTLEYFFRIPGKRLRPVLLLLSARAANSHISGAMEKEIIRMAAAVELIHAASLIHDDVIDEDLLRRGQKTLNNVYGNKIAVLAGDALYSRAFLMISSQFPKGFMQLITGMTESMSMAEIERVGGNELTYSKDMYYNLIKSKTALFTAYCCRLGANLATSDINTVSALENYGMNFGMTYQIVDDYADNDPIAVRHIGLKESEEFAKQAESCLQGLEDSVYKTNLIYLIRYVSSLAHIKV
ncbi:MAG: polyprenyl synthetase family protein [Ruminiclostridium sp.]|nr:polyprenyl synthetase family protein [Ruminiclostridium sp.]